MVRSSRRRTLNLGLVDPGKETRRFYSVNWGMEHGRSEYTFYSSVPNDSKKDTILRFLKKSVQKSQKKGNKYIQDT